MVAVCSATAAADVVVVVVVAAAAVFVAAVLIPKMLTHIPKTSGCLGGQPHRHTDR